MNRPAAVFRALELTGGSLVPFTSTPGERVRVLCGRIWLTEEGNPRDAFLGSGDEVSLAGRRLAVIEALGPARVHLVEDVPTAAHLAGAAAAHMRRLVRWLARLSPRSVRPARGVV